MNHKLNRRSSAARFHIIASRRLALFNHATRLFTRRFERLTRLVIAKFFGKVVQYTMSWNEVTIAVALDEVSHRNSSLFQDLLVSQSRVGVTSNLLRTLLCIRDNAPCVVQCLVETKVGLVAYLLGLFLRRGSFVGRGVF